VILHVEPDAVGAVLSAKHAARIAQQQRQGLGLADGLESSKDYSKDLIAVFVVLCSSQGDRTCNAQLLLAFCIDSRGKGKAPCNLCI
jgi:hypothetical protein